MIISIPIELYNMTIMDTLHGKYRPNDCVTNSFHKDVYMCLPLTRCLVSMTDVADVKIVDVYSFDNIGLSKRYPASYVFLKLDELNDGGLNRFKITHASEYHSNIEQYRDMVDVDNLIETGYSKDERFSHLLGKSVYDVSKIKGHHDYDL